MGTDGRTVRWDEHNAARRARILDAAIAVIEEHGNSSDLHVRQIADRAGVARPVVYRFFDDRADLDRAITRRVLRQLSDTLAPALTLDGSALEVIGGIIRGYVQWAGEHPTLHLVVEREIDHAGDEGDMGTALVGLIRTAAGLLDVTLSEEEEAALPLLVSGLIGTVFAAVRHWLARPVREPSADALSELLTRSIWYLIDGNLRRHDLVLDPDAPLTPPAPA